MLGGSRVEQYAAACAATGAGRQGLGLFHLSVSRPLRPGPPQANDALRAEIERLRGEPSPLAAARAKREETLGDKEKFVKLLDNLQAGSGPVGHGRLQLSRATRVAALLP